MFADNYFDANIIHQPKPVTNARIINYDNSLINVEARDFQIPTGEDSCISLRNVNVKIDALIRRFSNPVTTGYITSMDDIGGFAIREYSNNKLQRMKITELEHRIDVLWEKIAKIKPTVRKTTGPPLGYVGILIMAICAFILATDVKATETLLRESKVFICSSLRKVRDFIDRL